jgi:hypothetical protein
MGIAGLPKQCSKCNKFANALEAIMTMKILELTKTPEEREFICTKCIERKNEQTISEHHKISVEEEYNPENYDPDYQER